MTTITKVFTFDAGHRLTMHKGKCFNLHGHTYKLELSILGSKLDENDMVMDFGDLKKIVHDVIDQWDHAMVLNMRDQININHCRQMGYKVFIFDGEPTAENMAHYLFNMIGRKLPDDIVMAKVKLWETPTSYAEVL